MTDGIRFDLSPRTEFADRLEADLLRAIGDPALPSPITRAMPQDLDEEHIMTITLDPPTDQPVPPQRRTWVVALAAAAAVLLVLVGVWAVSRKDDPAGSRDVAFTIRWRIGTTIRDCPSDVTSPTCAFRYDGSFTATFSGDLDGNAFQSGVWTDSDDFPDRAVRHEEKAVSYVFGGTVAGCGTGQFLMIEAVQNVSAPDRDFANGTTSGTWLIVPGSGRGDLRTIAGSGTSSGRVADFDTVGRSLTGTVTCTPPKDLSANEVFAPLGSFPVPTDRNTITPAAGDLPNGTYRAAFSAEDLDRIEPDVVHDFTDGGSLEVVMKDGTFTVQGFLPSGKKDGEPFSGTYQVTGNTIVWLLPQDAQVPNSDGINVFEWSIEGDTLTFTQVDGKHLDPWFAVPYTRVP